MDPAASSGPSPGIAEAEARLAVRQLDLSHFRNYHQLRLHCDGRMVVLTGANGAGKTNLLEALSFLTPGRGLRRARLSDVRPFDSKQPWAIAARLDTVHGEVRIGTGLSPEAGRERRVVRIDGEPAKGPLALAEYVSCVWLTPAMDRLFMDGASARRRFLDRLVFTIDARHAERVARYEHGLRERARLLRDQPAGAGPWLAGLEQQAAELGIAVARARAATLAGLNRVLGDMDSRFPHPRLSLRGKLEQALESQSDAEAVSALVEAFAAARPRDREIGGSTVGPHRCDLVVHDVELDRPAARCSTGRQKALLVSIVLAETLLRAEGAGGRPILLLDEVVAHLDEERRQGLFALLRTLGAQAWLTGTDKSLFAPLADAAEFFSVCDGMIARHDPTDPDG
ncbi:MAG: DNA replication/repair protein RecF [Geminicoccaceae bacterium]